ncbi:putative KH domain-containing, RNA-binding, signal transduction-associated protein 1 [Hypsibius exemplaris]|uniref:KH domain-containing, RNA-binding, signal transduction-associated protein 1 n=1 Tax=Hypsibius exemplaris TaxID=2072580 RepID=A0A9X6ND50_HYPEX|nr:putative KH domain-containing, RNA-binding, signal transduction-associated protein 1 [Hypsibius exemplaris]
MSYDESYAKQDAYPEPQQQDGFDDGSGGPAQAASNGHHGHIAATGMPELPSRPAYKLPEETETFIQQAEAELALLGLHSPLVRQLAERELARIKAGEVSEAGYVIVHKDAPIKVVKKFLIPIKEYPKINFVGRILGPKGSTLKGLQASTRSRIMIFGRGSMWDKNKNSGRGSEEYKAKEDEARNSGDPKYAHLNEDLHVYVEITAYPVEAQSRFAHVMSELKKFLDPNHTVPYGQFQDAGIPPPGIRPPMGHGPRGPPPRGYGPPRPPMGARYPPPPRAAPPSAYEAPSYSYNSAAAAQPAAETSYRPAGEAATAAYGYAAYPASEYAAAPAASAYDSQAVQAQQYAAQRQGTAQPAYGQPAAPSSYTPAYAAAAQPSAYGGGYAQPPAAKKPRMAAPYGTPGAY